MVRLDKFLVASILMLATRSLVMSAPAGVFDSGKKCAGGSCQNNQSNSGTLLTQKSPSSVSGTTTSNASPAKATQETKIAAVTNGQVTAYKDLSPDNLRHVASYLSIEDKLNLRATSKLSKETVKLHVRELYSLSLKWLENEGFPMYMDNDKDAILCNLYLFCLSSSKDDLPSFPTLEACLNDVQKEFPDFTSGMGVYGLVTAVKYKLPDVVSEMLKRGAKPNIIVKGYALPLVQASGYGDIRMTELLLNGGADPNVSSPEDRLTPLMAAAAAKPPDRCIFCEIDHLMCVKLLLEHRADKSLRNAQGATAFDIANTHKNAAMKLLLDGSGRAPRVWELYCSGRPWLLYPDVSKSGHLVKMYQFCMRKYRSTLMYYATVKACLDDVDKDLNELVRSSDDIEYSEINADILREILDRGTLKVDLTKLLHYRLLDDDVDTIKILLSHGINPNAPDSDGYTPLMRLANRPANRTDRFINMVKCAELLLANGADPYIKHPGNLKTALQFAKDTNLPMMDLLSQPSRTK